MTSPPCAASVICSNLTAAATFADTAPGGYRRHRTSPRQGTSNRQRPV
jgi:hypothetical protein